MYKLLIADDEPLVCAGVQSMLDWDALGIEIIGIARNGQKAAEIIEQNMPDIVITDIKMPIKTGLQLAKECNEKYGPIPAFIILTSYEDFNYARSALQAQVLDYLVKLEMDEKSLAKAVNNAIEVVDQYRHSRPDSQIQARSNMQALREKFFIRLLNDLFDKDEIYQVQIKELGINTAAHGYIAANCEMLQPAGRVESENSLSLYSSAIQLLQQTLERYLPCYVVPLDMWHFTVIFCLDDKQLTDDYKALIQEGFAQTASLLHSYMGLSLRAAIGTIVNNLRNLAISYRQSQHCGHEITDSCPFVFYDDGSSKIDNDYISEMKIIRQAICSAFEEINISVLNEALSRLSDIYIAHPDDLLNAMDTTCNILYMAISLLPDGENLLDQIFSDNREGYRILYRLHDVNKIAAWILKLRDGCNELLQTRHQTYKERVINNVKTYIQENLEKRLSLQEIAAVFNFSPNYLSHLFSKYAGESFVEYYTSIRIAAAKDMMLKGEWKNYEIAEKLGFENSFYFSKVFRKVEGISPREYLQNLKRVNSTDPK